MSDIRAALAQLYRREAEIAITDVDIRGQNYTRAIEKVWPLMPPSRVVVTDTPCFVHLLPDSQANIGSAMVSSDFVVNVQLVVEDADADIACEIALAFYPQIVEKLKLERKLGLSGWMLRALRTEGDFLRLFEEYSQTAGRTLVGLDLYLDMNFTGSSNNAGGTPPP